MNPRSSERSCPVSSVEALFTTMTSVVLKSISFASDRRQWNVKFALLKTGMTMDARMVSDELVAGCLTVNSARSSDRSALSHDFTSGALHGSCSDLRKKRRVRPKIRCKRIFEESDTFSCSFFFRRRNVVISLAVLRLPGKFAI